VAALDRAGPWLAVLLALSANARLSERYPTIEIRIADVCVLAAGRLPPVRPPAECDQQRRQGHRR